MDILSISLFTIISICIYLYWYLKNTYSYFEHRGIPYIKPTWIFGNFKEALLLKKHILHVYHELYTKTEAHKFIGIFSGMKPIIMVRDPQLAHAIMVKDFSYFVNRPLTVDPKVEPLFYNVANMQGDVWRNCRTKLTPAFTSGKMKAMFPLMKECGEKLQLVLENVIDQDTFEIKDLIARFTTDMIGSCAFGVDTNCLANQKSEIREMGSKIFKANYIMLLRFIWPSMPTALIKLLDAKFLSTSVENFFTHLVDETVKLREHTKAKRNDFIDLLIALKNEGAFAKFHDVHKDLNKFTKFDDESMVVQQMTAQSFVFFTAGFEPTSSTLSFVMFELAQHQEIQNKVRDEINNVLENNDSQLTFETLKLMTYTDMVIAETLRKHPLIVKLDRKCNQNYKIPDTDIVIREGTTIAIPVIGLHWDKKYYEKPDQFYPEHFTEEAKSKRPHGAYMPFGEGPRMCIAERFSKVQLKIGLIYILRNFSYRLSPKMKLPLEYQNSFITLQLKGGIWLQGEKL